MANQHFFDLYTIRVKRKYSNQHEILDAMGDEAINAVTTVTTFFEDMEEFNDYEDRAILTIKEDLPVIDQSNQRIYGFMKYGSYGSPSEIQHRAKQDDRTWYDKEYAQMRKYFYMFYLPKNSNVGALILHKIGNSGIHGILAGRLERHFSALVSDCMLEIKPVNFNLTSAKDVIPTALHITVSEKRSSAEIAVTGEVSPKRTRKRASIVVPLGSEGNFLRQILKAKNKEEYALSKLNPFIQTDLEDYEIDVDVKVKMYGTNKTIRVTNEFKYNTAVNVTDELKFDVDGEPTIKSLISEANAQLTVLRENGFL